MNDACTQLAVACEDGAVRLFEIQDDTLDYKKSLTGDKARILAVSWQPKSNFVVTGSAEGVIRRWNTVTGESVLKVSPQTLAHAIVCLLLLLQDGPHIV